MESSHSFDGLCAPRFHLEMNWRRLVRPPPPYWWSSPHHPNPAACAFQYVCSLFREKKNTEDAVNSAIHSWTGSSSINRLLPTNHWRDQSHCGKNNFSFSTGKLHHSRCTAYKLILFCAKLIAALVFHARATTADSSGNNISCLRSKRIFLTAKILRLPRDPFRAGLFAKNEQCHF